MDFSSSKVSILCPYVNLSTEKDQEVIDRNKKYAKLLYGVCAGILKNQPFMSLLHYMDLPTPYLKKDLVSEHAYSVSCGYYEGKPGYWRNYQLFTDSSDYVFVGVDLGLSDGMKKVLESVPKEKLVYVSIKDLNEVCEEKQFNFEERELPEGTLNLIEELKKKLI